MLVTYILIGITLLLFLGYWYGILPARSGLRVLMYHKVAGGPENGLTVTPATLLKHVQWLKQHGFVGITLDQLHRHLQVGEKLPTNSFLLTFDDAYTNNLELAAPILTGLEVKPVVFIPTSFIGKTNEWDQGEEPIMSSKELQSIQKMGWDLGFHGHKHQHLGAISLGEAKADLHTMILAPEVQSLSILPSLAYPYGGRPKTKEAQKSFTEMLTDLGLQSAFRIGNRINAFPIRNRYQIQRLDIKGNMTDLEFKRKVKYGKVI